MVWIVFSSEGCCKFNIGVCGSMVVKLSWWVFYALLCCQDSRIPHHWVFFILFSVTWSISFLVSGIFAGANLDGFRSNLGKHSCGCRLLLDRWARRTIWSIWRALSLSALQPDRKRSFPLRWLWYQLRIFSASDGRLQFQKVLGPILEYQPRVFNVCFLWHILLLSFVNVVLYTKDRA